MAPQGVSALFLCTLYSWHRPLPCLSLPTALLACKPHSPQNYCLLIGDAAHAVVPFYGQGMNASLQDVEHLNRLLDDHHDDWDAVMPIYTRLRQPEGNAISDLSHRFARGPPGGTRQLAMWS